MTIPLTGANGLFTIIGHLGQILNDINGFLGGPLTVDGRATDVSATLVTKLAGVEADYAAAVAQYQLIQGAVPGLPGQPLEAAFVSYQGVHGAFRNFLVQLAQNTLIKLANDDLRLSSLTLPNAVTLLLQQMVAAGASVKANVPALGAQTSVGTPTGTPTIVGTVKSGTGRYSGVELLVAETITFACSVDAQSGGATADQETFSVRGQAAVDPLAWDWPKGSGASIGSLNVVDPTQNNSGGTVLTNGSMDTWTTAAQPPDNWAQLAGVRGTDYDRETSTVFASSPAALKIIGGSGVGASLAQTFNLTPTTTPGVGGTSYDIAAHPEANFIVNLQIKADVVPASGIITVDLIDGSNAIIADSNGTNNSFTITLSGITTSYAAKSGVFRLPADAPTTVKLRVRASTVVPGGSNVYVDDLALTPANGLYGTTPPYYKFGPQFAMFRGATRPLVNDTWTLATSISAAGAVQRVCQKFWNTPALGVALPSKADGTQTIPETVVA